MAKDATAGLPASDVNEDDYQALLSTLSASALGRAFLAEFARRNRAAETETLLTAMARLETLIAAQHPPTAEAPVEPATADTLVKPIAAEAPVEAATADTLVEPATAAAASEPAAAEAPAEATAIPQVTWVVEISLPAEQREAAAAASESPPAETTPAARPRDASEEATPPRGPLTQIMALSEAERIALFS